MSLINGNIAFTFEIKPNILGKNTFILSSLNYDVISYDAKIS